MTTGLLVGLIALAVQLVVGLFQKRFGWDVHSWGDYAGYAVVAFLIFFFVGWAVSSGTDFTRPVCIEPVSFLGEC